LRPSRSASSWLSAHTTKTAALACGVASQGDGIELAPRRRAVISAPPSALMKCANEKASPKCAASAAD